MRMPLFMAALLLVLTGCSGSRSSTNPGAQAPQNSVMRTNATGLTVSPAANTSAVGRVARVNSGGGFVILSYPLGQLPPVGKRLSVYRDGMKVGELKVTEPQYQQNTVADIMAGEVQAGDEARDR
jgi:hypothetical protein